MLIYKIPVQESASQRRRQKASLCVKYALSGTFYSALALYLQLCTKCTWCTGEPTKLFTKCTLPTILLTLSQYTVMHNPMHILARCDAHCQLYYLFSQYIHCNVHPCSVWSSLSSVSVLSLTPSLTVYISYYTIGPMHYSMWCSLSSIIFVSTL